MVGHLGLQPGLQHPTHQARSTDRVAGQLDPFGACPGTTSAAQFRIAGSSATNGTLSTHGIVILAVVHDRLAVLDPDHDRVEIVEVSRRDQSVVTAIVRPEHKRHHD
jgi:hypothetical protein